MTIRGNLDTLIDSLPHATTKELGDAFEIVSDWALLQSAEYGPQIVKIERYPIWAKQAGVSTVDTGIDAIATTVTGAIWAIQNKGRRDAHSTIELEVVTKLDVLATKIGAEKRFIVTSGAALARHAATTNLGLANQVILLNRAWLRKSTVWPSDYSALRTLIQAGKPTKVAVPFEYREHQIEARRDILAALTTHQEVQFISACGTGKTVTSFGLAEGIGAKTVVYFVPGLSLMQQTIRRWRELAGVHGLNVLAVCSDKKVGKRRKGSEDDDEQYLAPEDLGCDVLSDPVRIAARMAEFAADRSGRLNVVFCTYASAELVVIAQHQHKMPGFDFAFLDEAHGLVGQSTSLRSEGELVKRKDDGEARLVSAARVYATATPRLLSEKLRKQVEQEGRLVDSMDPTGSAVFGPRAYTLGFDEAIRRNILSDYLVSVIAVPYTEMVESVDGNAFVRTKEGDLVTAQTFAGLEALKQAYAAGDRTFITYHSRINRAEAFAEIVERTPGLPSAAHINGTVPADDREAVLERLGDGNPDGFLVTNVSCLSVGVDVPILDTIMILDPKQSVTDITQCVGRVLRPHESKARGHIIIPIAVRVDDLNQDELTQEQLDKAITNNPTFAAIFNVFAALEEHDDSVRHFMTELRTGAVSRTAVRSTSSTVDVTADGTDYSTIFAGTSVVGGNPKCILEAPWMSAVQRDRLASSIRLVAARKAGRRLTPAESQFEAAAKLMVDLGDVETVAEGLVVLEKMKAEGVKLV